MRSSRSVPPRPAQMRAVDELDALTRYDPLRHARLRESDRARRFGLFLLLFMVPAGTAVAALAAVNHEWGWFAADVMLSWLILGWGLCSLYASAQLRRGRSAPPIDPAETTSNPEGW